MITLRPLWNEQPSLDLRSSSAPVPSYSTEPRSRTTQSIIHLNPSASAICPWTLLSWTAADVTRADRAFVRIRMHDTCNSVRGKLQTARQSSAHWQRACAHSLARPPTRHPALHPAPRVSTMESMQDARVVDLSTSVRSTSVTWRDSASHISWLLPDSALTDHDSSPSSSSLSAE